MNSSVKAEIDSCIRELDAIVRELNAISGEVRSGISGVNTVRYTRGLEYSASKYQRAAQTLGKIH